MESTLSGRAATIGDNGLCIRAGAYVCVCVCVRARASIMSVLITVQVDHTLGRSAGSTTEFCHCCNMLRASPISAKQIFLWTITFLFVVQSSSLLVYLVALTKFTQFL